MQEGGSEFTFNIIKHFNKNLFYLTSIFISPPTTILSHFIAKYYMIKIVLRHAVFMG